MKIISLLCLFVVISGVGYSTTVYVPDDYPTIQEAVDASKDGDTVIVRKGTYYENVSFNGKAITLKSEKAWNFTRIHTPLGNGVEFTNGEGPDSVLDGFSIEYHGKGIVTSGSSPTIKNCWLRAIYPNDDYGIHNVGSTPTIINTTLDSGLYNSASDPTVVGSQVSGILVNADDSSPIFVNTQFFGDDYRCANNYSSSPTFTNCLMAGGEEPSHASIFANYDSQVVVANSIFVSDEEPLFANSGSTLTITYSNIPGSYPGEGNIDADPLFHTNFMGFDTHLTANSPCKDAGNNDAVNIPTTDFEGDPRVANGTVDMGPDEVYTHLYLNSPIDPDLIFFPGTDVEVLFTDSPGEPVLLAIGSGDLDDPIPTNWGDWWNDWWLEFPIFGPFYLGAIPANGVLEFTATIPNDVPDGTVIPVQALVGDSLTNLGPIPVGLWL